MYDGHFYRARIGLIPTKACIASLSLLIGLDDTPRGFTVLPFIHLPPNAQDREQEAVLDDSFYVINDGRANNFDLYRQYYQAYSLGPDAPPKSIIYEQKSTFTVEVK